MRSLQQGNCLRCSELLGRSGCLGVLRYSSCSWGWHPVLQHFSPSSTLLIAAAGKGLGKFLCWYLRLEEFGGCCVVVLVEGFSLVLSPF